LNCNRIFFIKKTGYIWIITGIEQKSMEIKEGRRKGE
jgi:hypothetical protein